MQPLSVSYKQLLCIFINKIPRRLPIRSCPCVIPPNSMVPASAIGRSALFQSGQAACSARLGPTSHEKHNGIHAQPANTRRLASHEKRTPSYA